MYLAKLLDAAITMGVMLLLLLSAFYVGDVNKRAIAEVCCVLFASFLVAFAPAMGYAMHKQCLTTNKAFQFFLCHHNADAGCVPVL